MFILIGFVALLLYAALVFYIGWRGMSWIKLWTSSRRFSYLYIVVLAVVASSFLLGQLSNHRILGMISAYWLAIFYLLLILVPLARVTVWLLRYTQLPHDRTRLWTGVVTLVLVVFLLAYGSYQAYSPVVRSYEVHIPKQASSLSSLKVVMAADMHFGVLSGKDHAARLVREVNALEPDIVLFPGDLFDDDIEPYKDQGIDRLLAQIEAPYGVYATLGNHDKYDGTMEELIELLERSGMRVLYDEAVTVDDTFTLIGRKDRSDPNRVALSYLMEGVNHSKPVILLDHQPYELGIAQYDGVDLMVSGHTHRGQVFPGNLITDAIYENDWGYLQKEQLHSIVTSGFGFWGPPIRLGTRSEVVEIDVTFGAETEG